jgi:predicted nucleic acid-binding protein
MSIATLDAAIGPGQRILVESTTIISLRNTSDHTHPLARHVFARIEDAVDPLTGYYSLVSATEVLVRPIRAGPAAQTYMHTFLTAFPNLHPLAVDFNVALQAATIRATTGLKTPDALIVASGLLAGCEAIVTSDEAWGKRLAPLFPRFRWIYLPSHI